MKARNKKHIVNPEQNQARFKSRRKVRVFVRVDDDLHRRFKAIASEKGMSMSALLQQILENKFGKS